MRRLGKWGSLVASLAFLATCPMQAAEVMEGETALRERLRTLLPFFSARPGDDLKDCFVPAFLQALEAKQIRPAEPFKDMFDRNGKAVEFRVLRMSRPYAADVEIVFDKNVRVPMTIGLEGQPPYRISGLLLQPAIRDGEKVADVIKDLQALPGQAGFCLMRLGQSPETVWDFHATTPLAVGSCMKLVVFATLVDEIAKGARKWEDVVPVKRDWISLPAGLVQDWPEGAAVTLQTLAILMLTRSDNTAADHLIRLLGRERVEAMQRTLGIARPERNQPFLLTAETFKYKLILGDGEREQFAAADSDGRRKLLESIRTESLARPRPLGKPVAIDSVEWFFSPADLCRTLDWIRRQMHVPGVADLLGLAKGLLLDEQHWYYVGYKGGMEPGVLCHTVLLKDKNDRWYAFAIIWNDVKNDVDQTQLVVLAQRLLRLAQRL